MDAIAERARVSRRTVFNAFGSKAQSPAGRTPA
ncbi:MAG TPA: TetR family transcriptional regulator [Acidimicrobiia bacterium]|nr:TetR family transcriptional regulator [Acidimicrobiia bacterium]